ncbi:hypothetical protein P9112_000841 [Eukaryota sp. TZLM1-RC]
MLLLFVLINAVLSYTYITEFSHRLQTAPESLFTFPYSFESVPATVFSTPPELSLPRHFDIRSFNCGNYTIHQGLCGSCYAWAAVTSLQDRFCYNNHKTAPLSPQSIISCGWSNLGCSGGSPWLTYNYLKRHGSPSLQCYPYSSGMGHRTTCRRNCVDGSPFDLYYSNETFFYRTESDMQAGLFLHGSMQIAFFVYADFLSHQLGIYHHTKGRLLGVHSVRLIGWGTESGVPYWLCANSFGDDWGDQGFFKIRRGSNECGLEWFGGIGGSPVPKNGH